MGTVFASEGGNAARDSGIVVRMGRGLRALSRSEAGAAAGASIRIDIWNAMRVQAVCDFSGQTGRV
jgi:hypothetical protein